jgi:dUTP pyrophosphatase
MMITDRRIKIGIMALDPKAWHPEYATKGSVGADLRACIDSQIEIGPGQTKVISTGIAIDLPYNYAAEVRSRSGMAAKNSVVVANSPGTIDSDYKGEIKVILINHGDKDTIIFPRQRIAQLVIVPAYRADFESIYEMTESTRGKGGLGSTGNE